MSCMQRSVRHFMQRICMVKAGVTITAGCTEERVIYEKQEKSGVHIADSRYCRLSDRRGAGRCRLRYRGDRARDHIVRKFEKRKGQKAVSDRYYHRSRCDCLHDSPLCMGRTASGGDAEGTAPSSDNDVERTAGRRYGEHCAGRNSDTDAVPEADR